MSDHAIPLETINETVSVKSISELKTIAAEPALSVRLWLDVGQHADVAIFVELSRSPSSAAAGVHDDQGHLEASAQQCSAVSIVVRDRPQPSRSVVVEVFRGSHSARHAIARLVSAHAAWLRAKPGMARDATPSRARSDVRFKNPSKFS